MNNLSFFILWLAMLSGCAAALAWMAIALCTLQPAAILLEILSLAAAGAATWRMECCAAGL